MPATTPRSDENQDCFADKSKHPYVSAVFVKNLRAFSVDAGLKRKFWISDKNRSSFRPCFCQCNQAIHIHRKICQSKLLKKFFLLNGHLSKIIK